jgi:hypothetical protein
MIFFEVKKKKKKLDFLKKLYYFLPLFLENKFSSFIKMFFYLFLVKSGKRKSCTRTKATKHVCGKTVFYCLLKFHMLKKQMTCQNMIEGFSE